MRARHTHTHTTHLSLKNESSLVLFRPFSRMAEANLFPSPIPSPDLISLEEITLTEEEKKIAEALGWKHKFNGIVSCYRTNQVRWLLVLVPFIIRLLSARGGVDVMEHLIDYLTVNDFLYLAAVTDGHLMPFFRSTSRIYKRFTEKIIFKLYSTKRDCIKGPVALRPAYFALNHWKLLHAPKPMYFVWGKKGWSKVGRDTYVRAKRAHRATAITKQGR